SCRGQDSRCGSFPSGRSKRCATRWFDCCGRLLSLRARRRLCCPSPCQPWKRFGPELRANNRTLKQAEGNGANDSSWDVSPEPGLRLLVKESAKPEMVARKQFRCGFRDADS